MNRRILYAFILSVLTFWPVWAQEGSRLLIDQEDLNRAHYSPDPETVQVLSPLTSRRSVSLNNPRRIDSAGERLFILDVDDHKMFRIDGEKVTEVCEFHRGNRDYPRDFNVHASGALALNTRYINVFDGDKLDRFTNLYELSQIGKVSGGYLGLVVNLSGGVDCILFDEEFKQIQETRLAEIRSFRRVVVGIYDFELLTTGNTILIVERYRNRMYQYQLSNNTIEFKAARKIIDDPALDFRESFNVSVENDAARRRATVTQIFYTCQTARLAGNSLYLLVPNAPGGYALKEVKASGNSVYIIPGGEVGSIYDFTVMPAMDENQANRLIVLGYEGGGFFISQYELHLN